MKSFIGLNLPLDEISRSTFPLPTLSSQVKSLAQGLYAQNGFFVIRGLEPRRYSSVENMVMYLGLSAYVSERRGRQDEHSNMLLHLVDLGSSAAPDNLRQAPYSNVGQVSDTQRVRSFAPSC